MKSTSNGTTMVVDDDAQLDDEETQHVHTYHAVDAIVAVVHPPAPVHPHRRTLALNVQMMTRYSRYLHSHPYEVTPLLVGMHDDIHPSALVVDAWCVHVDAIESSCQWQCWVCSIHTVVSVRMRHPHWVTPTLPEFPSHSAVLAMMALES